MLGDPLSALPVCPIPRRPDVSLELQRQPPRRAKKSLSIAGTCSHSTAGTHSHSPQPDILIPTTPLRSPLLATSLTPPNHISPHRQQPAHTGHAPCMPPSHLNPQHPAHSGAISDNEGTSRPHVAEASKDSHALSKGGMASTSRDAVAAMPWADELCGVAEASIRQAMPVNNPIVQSSKDAEPRNRLSGHAPIARSASQGPAASSGNSGLPRLEAESHISEASNVPGSTHQCKANTLQDLPSDTFSTSHVADGGACTRVSSRDPAPAGDSSVLSVLLSSFQPRRTSSRPSTAPPRARRCAGPGMRLPSGVRAHPPASAAAAAVASSEPSTRQAVVSQRVQSAGTSSGWEVPEQPAAATAGPCAEPSARAAGLMRRLTVSTEAGVYLTSEVAKVREPWGGPRNDFHVRGWSRAVAYNNTVGANGDDAPDRETPMQPCTCLLFLFISYPSPSFPYVSCNDSFKTAV